SLLIDRFLELINKEGSGEPGYKHKKLSASAKNLLLQHTWPGNIRELQNTLTRAAVWSVDEELDDVAIREALLPIPVSDMGGEFILNKPLEEGIQLPAIMNSVAVHYLGRGLAASHGNKTKAAKILGLPSYQTLSNWLKKYGLE
ncbi:MAG TPA: helix-turn-helix domain-containing protein, partial [Dissulfurispiraceae bacterium]|nr:helix-turn-helix domain-containing protein [Dissulfurispiraceae bacterium]